MRRPLSLHSDELSSALVERLPKAMLAVRPRTPRRFFGLANRRKRWELKVLGVILATQDALGRFGPDGGAIETEGAGTAGWRGGPSSPLVPSFAQWE